MSSRFVNMFELAVTMSGLLLAIPFAIHALGGWGHVHELVLAQKGSGAATESMFSMVGVGSKQILAWIAILGAFVHDLPGAGARRCMEARDVKAVRLAWG